MRKYYLPTYIYFVVASQGPREFLIMYRCMPRKEGHRDVTIDKHCRGGERDEDCRSCDGRVFRAKNRRRKHNGFTHVNTV